MSEQIHEPNIFMLCEDANPGAFRDMPDGFHTRLCRRDEVHTWKLMPFDDEETAKRYIGFMDDYFDTVYAPKGNKFFEECLFVVDQDDEPVGTCFSWKSYDRVTTIAWYKVKKQYEGKGIGRALLSEVMRKLSPSDYPVLLHTQPSSDRAIKLYSDFGFKLITDEQVGQRANNIQECLPLLKAAMPGKDYDNLKFSSAPKALLDFLSEQSVDEF